MIKDLMLVNEQLSLDKIKDDFTKYEKEFETIKEYFIEKDEDDFLDTFIVDLHNHKSVLDSLNALFKNEKQIEVAFEKLYNLQKEKINLVISFNKEYPTEKKLRNKIEKQIIQTNNTKFVQIFGDVKYYSKETLYQYKNQKSLNIWLKQIDKLSTFKNQKQLNAYKNIVKRIGFYVISIKNIETEELLLQNNILEIIRQNKIVNLNIEKNVEQLSSSFINTINILVSFLLITTILFIIFLGQKVLRNVGLSVDQIEQKVQDGLKEIKNLNNEIQTTQKEVVFTMGAIGESRSKETGNHVKRVAEYSKVLALHYGLSQEDAEMLKQASPMHDIGKVAIPDSILNKPARFDPRERMIMDSHAQLGFEMLNVSDRPLLKLAATIAYEHHEKWDGTGYPQGLKGENISISGRITAIADVFDALGSDRIYKKAWEDEKIFELFKEERGKHFEPKLVDIFFENLDEFLKIRDNFKDI